MLLDLSFSNLFLENLGATIDNLLNFTNLLVYDFSTLNFDNLYTLVNIFDLWPTDAQFISTINNVLFIVYTNDSYLETVRQVYEILPYVHALDYLHLFYVKQVVYKTFIAMHAENSLTTIKPMVISLQLDFIFSSFFNKWGYTTIMLGLTYFFSNIMKYSYQYGFNFYFNYFKTLADLGEQEYGSYDDFKFFLFLLVQMLAWYCWVFFIGYTFFLQSESTLVLMTLSIMITMLTIPVSLLWDFGLAFAMYVSGAASSSNLVVEAFFDVIGVIIIFTRFIVQNIRFLMVFVAFFELFEWTFSSTETSYILKLHLDMCSNLDFFTMLESNKLHYYIIMWLKTGMVYLYHLLHLIIVSFMQIGVYLMVSFWLFFFLYTSFFKLTTDSYFSVKSNVNVC